MHIFISICMYIYIYIYNLLKSVWEREKDLIVQKKDWVLKIIKTYIKHWTTLNYVESSFNFFNSLSSFFGHWYWPKKEDKELLFLLLFHLFSNFFFCIIKIFQFQIIINTIEKNIWRKENKEIERKRKCKIEKKIILILICIYFHGLSKEK